MADRYAYVPMIGIFIILSWGIPDLLSRFSWRHGTLIALSAAVIGSLAAVSYFQVSHWQNSEKLFRHALLVTRDNHLAQNGMGYFYLLRGDYERAAVYLQEALRIRPDYAAARNNLGIVYMKQGRFDEAIAQYRIVLEIRPGDVKGMNSLGVALACRGQYDEAIGRFREALRIDPGYGKARDNLANAEIELERSVSQRRHSQSVHLPLDRGR
jgi:Flp pilus assembly protein TadD